MNQGSVKLVVSGKVLRDILDDHPEVEIELIGSATAQIASHFAEKLKAKMPNASEQVEAAFKRQLATLSGKALTPELKAVIREHLHAEMGEWAKYLVRQAVGDVALARADDLIKTRIDKGMLAMNEEIRKYQSQNQAWITTTAEEIMMKLIRGTLKIQEQATT